MPSEPSRGQLAPPSASTVASASRATSASSRVEAKPPGVVPAGPAVAKCECVRRARQPPQPGAQQRRGLELFGNTRPLEPTKVGSPELFAPGAQARRAKRLDRVPQRGRGLAVARQKRGSGFAVREVEPPRPASRNLRADRRHPLVDGDRDPGARQHLGRHQPGGPAADDRRRLRFSPSCPRISGCAKWREEAV